MELFANDRSIHGQFHDLRAFRDALARLMAMRAAARRFGREVHCHREFLTVIAIPGVPLQQTLGQLAESERRAAFGWLTRGGPFWDDVRRHGVGDWLEYRGEVVAETAVGEAAFRALHDNACGLVSVSPSDWEFSPVEVIWRREAEGLRERRASLDNWWDVAALEAHLQTAAPPIKSWDALRDVAIRRFGRLTFAGDCFRPIAGLPFSVGAAERVLLLFDILARLVRAFDSSGRRTAEGHDIYRTYFTGGNALFSDSSDTEKLDFRNELTFRHPDQPGRSLFCPWHGKVRHLELRVHYTWSGRAGEPLYVVYVGPKITKR